MTGKLVLCRHGQSTWNLENLFTGWHDVDLTEQVLKRAIRTLWIILDEMDLMWIPVERSWKLNERHYGALQGLHKAETADKHGEDQVKIWRRSYDIAPPALEKSDQRHPCHDPRYAGIENLPATESLKTTLERVQPYWEQTVAPQLKAGNNILISAHGNSLRALVKMLDGISDQDITEFNIPTGVPILYELDSNLAPLSREFLGDPEAIKQAAAAVAQQAAGK